MKLQRRMAVALSVAALTVGMAVSALAADTVTQTVNAGTRSATIADLALAAKPYSHTSQTSTGSMTLTADDSTGSGNGWNVTVQAGNLTNGTNTITASNLALSSAAAPTSTAGQAIDVTGGPKVPATSPVGTLDTARKVLQADANFGQGTYTQALGVTLTIPGQTKAGTYTGTLTTTITAGP